MLMQNLGGQTKNITVFSEVLQRSILLLYFLLHKKIAKSKVTSNSVGAVIKLPRRVYSRNSEASVSNDGKIPGFCFC